MNSIDRKILRCQREIEAAQPKGLSFAEFETGIHPGRLSGAMYSYVSEADCRQIKGAAQAPMPKHTAAAHALAKDASPVAAPPSHVFKAGDRFRVKEQFAKYYKHNEFTAVKVDDGKVFDNSNSHTFFWHYNIELISPASETETEGWKLLDASAPDLPAGSFELLGFYKKNHWRAHENSMSLHSYIDTAYPKQYRVVKP